MAGERRAIIWTPQWEGPVEKWARSYIWANRWRCDSIHDPDDLLQDAYLIFIKVSKAYPKVIEAAHFMALFKTALRNQITDQARYVQRKRISHVEIGLDTSELYSIVGDLTNAGHLLAALAEAPEEVRMALDILEKRPKALRRTSKRRHRDNMNTKLRRLAGIKNGFDVMGTLKQLLT